MPSRRANNFPESGRGLGHVTATIFGSTVGYPSDSLASCLLINNVRMSTFTHQLLSRKTSTPEVWQCEWEYSSRSATCPSRCWAMQKSFSFNQTES